MSGEGIRDRLRPWAGLALGAPGFFLAHQLGSDATFQDCTVAVPWIVILAVAAGLALIGFGAFGSWGVYAARTETPARRLVAVVSLLSCALFAIGVLLFLIASLVIPPCWA